VWLIHLRSTPKLCPLKLSPFPSPSSANTAKEGRNKRQQHQRQASLMVVGKNAEVLSI
jgi:hypothetical protein